MVRCELLPGLAVVPVAASVGQHSELDEIHAEQENYSDNLARSEEDGWFYADG